MVGYRTLPLGSKIPFDGVVLIEPCLLNSTPFLHWPHYSVEADPKSVSQLVLANVTKPIPSYQGLPKELRVRHPTHAIPSVCI